MTFGADLDGASRRLIDLANEGGGEDNITVVLVRSDGFVATPKPERIPGT